MNQTTATEATTTEKCPRCSGPLRKFEEDQGALSRAADVTVCGRCGSDEAIRSHQTGRVVPPEEWPVDDAHKFAGPPPEIAKLLAELDAVPAGHYLTLGEDHPLYEAPGTRKVYADSRLRNPARIHEALAANGVDGTHTFGTIYRLDGSEVPVSERVDGWWEQQEALTANTGALHATLDTFNAAARLGEEFVIVGRGRWFAVAEVDVDGEPGIEFVEWNAYTDDYYAKLDADRDEWLAAHPEIRDLGPSWAENIDVSPEEDGTRVVTYERDYDGGNRYVEATYNVATGGLTFATGQFVAYDYRGDLAGLEKFSADLARMVETIKTEGA